MLVCKQCQKQFEITSADRAYYAKLNVPEPTHCPPCRQQRRLAWRNERALYPRTCDKCGKQMISIYSSNKPYTVYCSDCWWKDDWTALLYSHEFDFNRPFFEQFEQLQLQVPRITLYGKDNENSEYTNHTDHAKNSYMCVDVGFGENLLYSQWMVHANNCVDCYSVFNSERCHETQYSDGCYGLSFCYAMEKCRDTAFSFDCRDAGSCFLSCNLHHKNYTFMNKTLSKEEYQKEMEKWDLGSYATLQKAWQEYQTMLREQAIHKYARIYYAEDSTGDVLGYVKNCKQCFHVSDAENCRYCYECIGIKDSYDAYESGFNCEMQYETHACNRTSYSKFATVCYDGSFIEYCDLSHNSSNLFGCVGLKKNEYCIFNKQYSKEEFKTLREKIIAHMRETGEWGEFFPIAMSLFGYNETIAPYYFPLKKEAVLAVGWKWEDAAGGTSGKTTLKPEEIPDNIKEVPDSITKELLECVECGKNYKVIKQELAFYKQSGLALPRLCPQCRQMQRFALRNPRQLWHRQCMCSLGGHGHTGPCTNEFKTTYAPDRPEKVFCEECYQKEVI